MGFYRRSGFKDGVRGEKPGLIFDRLNKDYFAGKSDGYEQYLVNQNLADQLSQGEPASAVESPGFDAEELRQKMTNAYYDRLAEENVRARKLKLDPNYGKCAFCGKGNDRLNHKCATCGRFFCAAHGEVLSLHEHTSTIRGNGIDHRWIRCQDHPRKPRGFFSFMTEKSYFDHWEVADVMEE